MRAAIEKQGWQLALKREESTNIDPVAWRFWLSEAVDGGQALLLSGTSPENPPTPRKLLEEEAKANESREIGVLAGTLTTLFGQQSEILGRLADKIG
jgi:hypothetical protein